jgi:AcrR family transcriptional regulator
MNTQMANRSQRERILTFVEKKLIEEGTTQFSVDEITGALGMSKKTFYQSFATKDAMLEELVGRVIGDVGRGIDMVTLGSGTFLEKIVALMRFLGTMYRRLAIPLSEEVHRRLPMVWERVEAFRQKKIQENFSRLLEQGRAEGFLRADVDQKVFLMAYGAAIRAIVNPNVLADHALTIPDVMEQIVRIFFGGIMTDAGRTAFDELHHRQQPQSH